jgi:uncharacterized delta-60 repeat protein
MSSARKIAVRSASVGARKGRQSRPMAEVLEARALLTVGLDPTYGFGGVAPAIAPANTSANNYQLFYNAVALQDGEVVELGTLTTTPKLGISSTTDLIVTRLGSDGFLDPTFGSGGTQDIPVAAGGTSYNVTYAKDILVQTDGAIEILAQVVPVHGDAEENETIVAQLTPNGALDGSFGTGGIELIPGVNGSRMAIEPDDKIVVAGSAPASLPVPGGDFAITRLNANGSPDTSFNGTGTATVGFDLGGAFAYSNGSAYGVVVQPDGKVVAVGQAYLAVSNLGSSVPSVAAVVRLNTNGTLDTSFNGTGTLTYSYPNLGAGTVDIAQDVAIDGSQLVILGTTSATTSNSSSDKPISQVTVTRLDSDGSFDCGFNGSGRYALALDQAGIAFDTSAGGIIVLPNSSIQVGGGASPQNSNTSAGGGYLLKLNPNGTPDATYGPGGMAVLPLSVDSRLLRQADGKLDFLSGGQVVRTSSTTTAVSTTIITAGSGKKARATGVTITFNTAVNPALLTDPSLWLVRAVKGRRHIKIKKKGGVSYNGATDTFTLDFARKTALGSGFVVVITARGIVGADGQVLSSTPIVISPTSISS